MSYINWGSESPEQLAIRRQLEHQALYEQAVRMAQARNRAGNAPGAVGGGSKLGSSKIGETILYSVVDNNGEHLLGFVDYPQNTFANVYHTGLFQSGTWSFNNMWPVQNKGYVVEYTNGNNDHTILFLDATGTLIGTIEVNTMDIAIDAVGGDFVFIIDPDAKTTWWFDGEELFTQTFADMNAIYWDNVYNLDGFYLTADDGNDNFKIFINNGTSFTEIASFDTVGGDNLFALHAYETSNILRVAQYDQGTGLYDNLKYISGDGTVKQTVDVSASGSVEWYRTDCWGYGRHLDTFPGASGYYHYFYNSNTDNEPVFWIHSLTDFPQFTVYHGSINKDDIDDTKNNNALIAWQKFAANDKGMTVSNNLDFLAVFGDITAPPTPIDPTVWVPNLTDSPIVAWGEYEIHVADSIYIPIATAINEPTPEINVMRWDNTGTRTPLLVGAWDDTDYIDSTKIGTRYQIDVYNNVLNNGGITHIIETDGANISFEVNNYDFFRTEWDRNTFAWCDLSKDDRKGYYVNDSISVDSPGETLGWDWSDFTTPYQTQDLMFPGNIILYGPTSSRLWLFNDVPDGNNNIDDGGNDMYDTGNYITTDLASEIPYTHTQMDGNVINSSDEATITDFIMDGSVQTGDSYFGTGSSYFTNMYPGMFVAVAKNVDLVNYRIEGGTGLDDNGVYYTDSRQITIGGTDYTAFIKCNYGSDNDEPTTNQIIIVDYQGGDLVQEIGDTDSDYHSITWQSASSVTQVHHLVFATFNESISIRLTDLQLDNIIEDYLTLVNGKNAAQTLTALNTNYATITALVNTPEKYWLQCISANANSSRIEVSQLEEMRTTGKNVVTLHYNASGKLVFRVYDLALNLLGSYTSQYNGYDSIITVDERILVVAQDFASRTGVLWTGSKFVTKNFEVYNNAINYYNNDIVSWAD